MTPDKEPVGIGQFTILGKEKGNNLIIEIESIVDLGLYLRNESKMFA